MKFNDFDKKPPEDYIYTIEYKGCLPGYPDTIFYVVPSRVLDGLEDKVLVVIQDPNIRPVEAIPEEIKGFISARIKELGIGHLGLIFPNPGDSLLEM
ncbi:MAG: hypothetical protein AABX33_04055 [Nanoarchaeota archaeon]